MTTPNCVRSLPCFQQGDADPATGWVLAIQALNPPHGGATAIYGQCDDGVAIGAAATNPEQNSSGIGVSATTQLGPAGQFKSSGGIGVEASAGLPDGGDPATQGIGVSATGNVAVQAQGNVGGVGVQAFGGTPVMAPGVEGVGVQANGGNIGVQAISGNGTALQATVTESGGVAGDFNASGDAAGVQVSSADGTALRASATGSGSAGIFEIEGFPSSANALTAFTFGTGLAGFFVGNVDVVEGLTATSKSFVIDHPLDPANKYLEHASVESSEQANVYSGNIVLDDQGEAVVNLPAWVEALNEDFRYQLTCVGRSAPVYVADEVAGNQFRIGGGTAGMKVSWQLTGIRKDAWAKAHPLVAERDKPEEERGYYRHPELFGSDRQHGIAHLRIPKVSEPQQSHGRAERAERDLDAARAELARMRQETEPAEAHTPCQASARQGARQHRERERMSQNHD